MPDLMLTREQRRRLRDILGHLTVCDTPEGRALLLRDLPNALLGTLPRSAAKLIDIDHIIDATQRWGLLRNGVPALLLVIDNALEYSEESELGQELQRLRDELIVPTSK